MSKQIKRWLAGAILGGTLAIAGCSPIDPTVGTQHLYGQPVQYETSYFILNDDGVKEYYANEEELKVAIQRQVTDPASTNPPAGPTD